jgi:hypothetical protein
MRCAARKLPVSPFDHILVGKGPREKRFHVETRQRNNRQLSTTVIKSERKTLSILRFSVAVGETDDDAHSPSSFLWSCQKDIRRIATPLLGSQKRSLRSRCWHLRHRRRNFIEPNISRTLDLFKPQVYTNSTLIRRFLRN